MEIQKVLSYHKASHIMIDYQDGQPVALTFAMTVDGYPINYRLPCNYIGVLKVMKSQKIPNSLKNSDQALRVSWRIIKDWISAQMAIIESGQASMEGLLMPFMVSNTGETLYERFQDVKQKLLS